jgi:hypothetical protein
MATKKITVEIEMTEEEAERFEHYIEKGCYDKEKLFKRFILKMINRFARQECMLFAARAKEVKKAV